VTPFENIKLVKEILLLSAKLSCLAFKILETGRLEMVSVLENVPSIVWLTPVSCED